MWSIGIGGERRGYKGEGSGGLEGGRVRGVVGSIGRGGERGGYKGGGGGGREGGRKYRREERRQEPATPSSVQSSGKSHS